MGRRGDLWLLVGGMGLSAVGSNITFIALPLHLRDQGPYAISAAMMAVLVPVALGAPLAGWLVDRFANRRLMVYAQVVAAAAVTAMTFALDTLPVLLLLLVVLGSASTVTNPAMSALLPRLTGEEGATRGYAALSTARSAGSLAGFALGGVLAAGPGVRFALTLDAATFAVLALALTAVRTERRPRQDGSTAGQSARRQRVWAGLRPLLADRVLMVALGGLTLAVLLAVLVNVAEVFFVFDVLRAGTVAYGLIAAAWGAGMVVGAQLAGRLDTDRELALGLFGCGVGLGAVLLAPAAVPTVTVTVVAWMIGGACNAAQTVAIQGLVRSRVPDELRGRAFAAMNAALVTANVLGTFAGGPATLYLGPRAVFAAAGVGTVVLAAVALVVVFPLLRGGTGRASTSAQPAPTTVRRAEAAGAAVVRAPGVGNLTARR